MSAVLSGLRLCSQTECADDSAVYSARMLRLPADFVSFRTEISHAIRYAKFYSRSHPAVIRVYDPAGNVIETHEHKSNFKECS